MRLRTANRRRKRSTRTRPPGIRPTKRPPPLALLVVKSTISDEDASAIRRQLDAMRGPDAWHEVLVLPADTRVEIVAVTSPRYWARRRKPAWLRAFQEASSYRFEAQRDDRVRCCSDDGPRAVDEMIEPPPALPRKTERCAVVPASIEDEPLP